MRVAPLLFVVLLNLCVPARASIISEALYVLPLAHEPMFHSGMKLNPAVPDSDSYVNPYSVYISLAVPAAGLFLLLTPKIQRLALRLRLMN